MRGREKIMDKKSGKIKRIMVLLVVSCFFFSLSFSSSVLDGNRNELKKEINNIPFTPFFVVHIETPFEAYARELTKNTFQNPDAVLLEISKEVDFATIITKKTLKYPAQVDWNSIKFITQKDVEALLHSPFIKDAFLVPYPSDTFVKFKGINVILKKVPPKFFRDLHLPLKYGQYFSGSDPYTVVITDNLSRKMFGTINPVGKKILCVNGAFGTDKNSSSKGTYYKIVGVLKPLSSDMLVLLQSPLYGGGYIPTGKTDSVARSLVMLVIPKEGYYNQALSLLKKEMKNKGNPEENAKPVIVSTYKRIGDLLTINSRKDKIKFILIAALFMLFIALFGVIGLIVFDLSQKSREIAIKRALGESIRKIFAEYYFKTMFSFAISAVIGDIVLIVLFPKLKLLNISGISASQTITMSAFLAEHSMKFGLISVILNFIAILIVPAIAVSISLRMTIRKAPAEGIRSSLLSSENGKINTAKIIVVTVIALSIAGTVFPAVLNAEIKSNINSVIRGIAPDAVRISSFPYTNTLSVMQTVFNGANYTYADYVELEKRFSRISLIGFREKLPEYFSVGTIGNATSHVLKNVRISEATVSFKPMFKLSIKKGRFVQDSDYNEHICVVGAKVAKILNIDDVGKSVIIEGNKTPYVVVGILNQCCSLIDNTIFIPNGVFPYEKFNSMFSKFTGNGVFLVKANNPDERLTIAKKVLDLLNKRHPDKSPGSIIDLDEIIKPVIRVYTSLYTLLSIFILLALLSAFLSLSALLFIEVIRRTREIGIKKAIGATAKDIIKEFTMNGLTTTLIALIIGIPTGIAVSLIIEKLKGWNYYIPVNILMLVTLISLLLGFLFSYLPALFASKTNPVEAIKSE